jgi:hypothetical protein
VAAAILMILVVGVAVYGWRKDNRARPDTQNTRTAQRVPVAAARARKGDIGVHLTGLGAVTSPDGPAKACLLRLSSGVARVASLVVRGTNPAKAVSSSFALSRCALAHLSFPRSRRFGFSGP